MIQSTDSKKRFIQLAGVSGLVVICIGILINFVFISSPPTFGAPLSEIWSFYEEQETIMRVGNSLRYLAQFIMILFAVGIYLWIKEYNDHTTNPWAMVGILGNVAVLPVGIVSNGIETITLWRIDTLLDNQEFFKMLWDFNSVVFSIGVLIPWGISIVGYSIGGRISGAIPMWLTIIGLIFGAAALISALLVFKVLHYGWVMSLVYAAFMLLLFWQLCVFILMVRRPVPRN